MIPGEIIAGEGPIKINSGGTRVPLTVRNTGDRPIQVGSHFHFAETNAALSFDREAAWGHRLAVPAGTSVRFEPGMPRDVELVPLAGRRTVPGLRGLAGGPLFPPPAAPPASAPPSSPPPTSPPHVSPPPASSSDATSATLPPPNGSSR